MSQKHLFIGIDVSAKTLAVAIPQNDAHNAFTHQEFDNTPSGIGALIKALPQNSWGVVEATGSYSMHVVHGLYHADICCSLINPRQSSGFSKLMMATNKNDQEDARLLAILGNSITLKAYEPKPVHVDHLRQLHTLYNTLQKHLTAIRNKLHAQSFEVNCSATAQAILVGQKQHLETQIATLEDELQQLTEQEFQQTIELMTSVVGIGLKTAIAILIVTGGLDNFSTAQQLSKFLGLAPTEHTSGSSVRGKRKICRTSVPYIRALLYMCARSGRQHNEPCKLLYNRLRNAGKCHRLAMVAVANKLVKQLFAIVKSETMFDRQYHKRFDLAKN